MTTLPEDYIVVKFFQFVGSPERNRYNGTYQGSCPMCREGSSWLKKRRFYFIPKKNRVFCHNCGYSKTPFSWIMEVANLTVQEIRAELDDVCVEVSFEEPKKKIEIDTLPKDCINLSDESQVKYYKDNQIVKKALEFLKSRFLDNAVNRPKAFYVSLTDRIHRNRLVIPFYDENDKIVYYQSRTILETEDTNKPRYLSKLNSDKTIFNINNVDIESDTIFVFEGPLNSCFVQNGVAIGGIQENSYQLYTTKQQEQIDKFRLHEKIWVLDSQWKDKASLSKTKKLLELKEKVFIWPKDLGRKYKDFNDISIDLKSNRISADFIKKYTK